MTYTRLTLKSQSTNKKYRRNFHKGKHKDMRKYSARSHPVTATLCSCYGYFIFPLQLLYFPVTATLCSCYGYFFFRYGYFMFLLRLLYFPVTATLFSRYGYFMFLLRLLFFPVMATLCSCYGYFIFPLQLLYFPVTATFWRSNQTSPKLVPLRLLLKLASN